MRPGPTSSGCCLTWGVIKIGKWSISSDIGLGAEEGRWHVRWDEAEKNVLIYPHGLMCASAFTWEIGGHCSCSAEKPGCFFEGTEIHACSEIPGRLELSMAWTDKQGYPSSWMQNPACANM